MTNKRLLITSFILILLLGVGIGNELETSLLANSSPSTGIIQVNGDATVSIAPDVAYISLGVETQNRLAESASQENAAIMNKVITALKEFGLTDQEITTSGYYIYSYQQGDYNSDPVSYYTIYHVRNQVNVKTDQLQNVGAIIDLAIKAGANQVQGITFDHENKAELKLTALQNATKQAQAKAEAIAEASGVTIKEIIRITEQSASYAPYTEAVVFKASGDASTSPINPGDVEVTGHVVVEFAF